MLTRLRADRRAIAVVALTALASAALLALALAGVAVDADALRVAGQFQDVAPIRGVGQFVDSIRGNLLWLALTLAVLCLLAVGILFMGGHSRASDIAMRIGLGFFVVVAAPGIAA
jgi:hypothetical protein